jgi:PAS domain-containing protein
MGGNFIDCNQSFSQLTGYAKDEMCEMTIFNLIAEKDLRRSLELITDLIMSTADQSQSNQDGAKSVILRLSLKDRTNLSLKVALFRHSKAVPKGFCLTLVDREELNFNEFAVPLDDNSR